MGCIQDELALWSPVRIWPQQLAWMPGKRSDNKKLPPRDGVVRARRVEKTPSSKEPEAFDELF